MFDLWLFFGQIVAFSSIYETCFWHILKRPTLSHLSVETVLGFLLEKSLNS